MSDVRIGIALAFFVFTGSPSGMAIAADPVFTGVFKGAGRACSGALYVRAKTIEWNSTYSVCKPTQYEILEKTAEDDRERVVFRLKNPSRQCRYSVVEVEHADSYDWNVSGYPSLEGFQKKDLPAEQVLSCLMTGAD